MILVEVEKKELKLKLVELLLIQNLKKNLLKEVIHIENNKEVLLLDVVIEIKKIKNIMVK